MPHPTDPVMKREGRRDPHEDPMAMPTMPMAFTATSVVSYVPTLNLLPYAKYWHPVYWTVLVRSFA